MSVKSEDAQMWTELGLLREEMDSPDLNRELTVSMQSPEGTGVSNEVASTRRQSLPLCS